MIYNNHKNEKVNWRFMIILLIIMVMIMQRWVLGLS